MKILLIFLASFFIIRFLFFFISAFVGYRKNLHNLQNKSTKEPKSFVSVIVPARNEENNIELSIRSITKSNYLTRDYEIIAVDDRSTDNTPEILDNLAKEIDNLRVIHLTESTRNPNLKGKAGALDAGINYARGEIIMMTDADCEVNPNWINTISSFFDDESVGIVPSFTLMKTSNLFHKIQATEWLLLHTMASGGAAANLPMGCYGNNLSVRKKVYDEIGGYENIKFSVTEDLALLKAVYGKGYKIKYILDANSTVTTIPVNTFKEYVSQHKRWAIGGLDLGWIAVFFVLSTFSIWLGILISLWSSRIDLAFVFFSIRILTDFIVTLPSIIKLKQYKLLSTSPISFPFFMFFELIVPFLTLDKKVKWKGQTFIKS
jgi:cellulose synthase/poly-beta-1,6-N-acetylglucosamine synthase-like glycosyltransferase